MPEKGQRIGCLLFEIGLIPSLFTTAFLSFFDIFARPPIIFRIEFSVALGIKGTRL